MTTAPAERPEAPHDHELEELEVDSRVPPRPEEEVADAEPAPPPADGLSESW